MYSAMPTAYNTGGPALLPFVGWFALFCFSVCFCDLKIYVFIEINYFKFLRFTVGYVNEIHASLEKITQYTLSIERFPSMNFCLPLRDN